MGEGWGERSEKESADWRDVEDMQVRRSLRDTPDSDTTGLSETKQFLWALCICLSLFFFSSRRRHTRFDCDWSSDVCSSDLWPRSCPSSRDALPLDQRFFPLASGEEGYG